MRPLFKHPATRSTRSSPRNTTLSYKCSENWCHKIAHTTQRRLSCRISARRPWSTATVRLSRLGMHRSVRPDRMRTSGWPKCRHGMTEFSIARNDPKWSYCKRSPPSMWHLFATKYPTDHVLFGAIEQWEPFTKVCLQKVARGFTRADCVFFRLQLTRVMPKPVMCSVKLASNSAGSVRRQAGRIDSSNGIVRLTRSRAMSFFFIAYEYFGCRMISWMWARCNVNIFQRNCGM